MSSQIPKTMKAVFLEMFGKPTIVKQIPVPVLKQNELLVKVEAAPVNPSDLAFLEGQYATSKLAPTVPGFEGAGTVVDAIGELEKNYIGKKVAFSTTDESSGSYGQYARINIQSCLPLPEELSFEQGCSAFINPFTVLCMHRIVQKNNVKAVVHTAAASQLGRQMMRYFQANGTTVIAVVRKQEQVEILEKLGAKYIINSSQDKWEEKVKEYAAELEATIAFDAIGGEITGKISGALPRNSTVHVYGSLSGQPISGVDTRDFSFYGKSIKGLYLLNELQGMRQEEAMEIAQKAPQLLGGDLKTDIQKVFSYEQFNEAVELYTKNMSAGKVIIKYEV